MPKQTNEFGVKTLTLFPAFKVVCPISKAPIQLKAKIELWPDRFLPEYMECQNAIRQTMENKSFTIEGAAAELVKYFKKEYQPKKVKVIVETINNNTFFPVVVEMGGDMGIADENSEDEDDIDDSPAAH